ncbi:hypothetical protein W823_03600 [Williamsia sp. D3]|nr:hypothetical protein W823_03600 [Williamsia sp. D3]
MNIHKSAFASTEIAKSSAAIKRGQNQLNTQTAASPWACRLEATWVQMTYAADGGTESDGHRLYELQTPRHD